MTAPFVSQLRASDDVVTLGVGAAGPQLHLRVQAAELWDAVQIVSPASGSIASVKQAALERFFPDGAAASEYVVKLRGFEILDEDTGLHASGVVDGSTLLIARRRRTPVK